jgi:hypothetical protein
LNEAEAEKANAEKCCHRQSTVRGAVVEATELKACHHPTQRCTILIVKMHRTNLSLLPRQMKRLEEESKKTGASIAELVRRAIDNTYPIVKVKVVGR